MDSKQTLASPNEQSNLEAGLKRQKLEGQQSNIPKFQGPTANMAKNANTLNAQQSLNDLVDSLSKKTQNVNNKQNDQLPKKKNEVEAQPQDVQSDPQTQLMKKIKQL